MSDGQEPNLTMQETIQGWLGKAAELTDPIWERIKTRINAATLEEAKRAIGIARRHVQRCGVSATLDTGAAYDQGYMAACDEIVEILTDMLTPLSEEEEEENNDDAAT